MTDASFLGAGRISYLLLNMAVTSEGFPRIPIKLRLLLAMMEHANTENMVRLSIRQLGQSMGVSISNTQLYRARDELVEGDMVRHDGRRHMINPTLFYKGSFKNGRWQQLLRAYSALPPRPNAGKINPAT